MFSFANRFEALQQRTKDYKNLSETLSEEIIEKAILLRGNAVVRRRKLPPETMIWLLVGIGLFRNRSLKQVAEELDLCVDGAPAASSLCEARKKLGPEPLKYLFSRLGEEWSKENDAEMRFRGLRLLGIDETNVNIADSKKKTRHFSADPGARKGPQRLTHKRELWHA